MTARTCLPRALRWLAGLASIGVLSAGSQNANALGADTAHQIRDRVLRLQLVEAEALVASSDTASPAIELERGRMLYYETRYDEAVAALDRADVSATDEGARLGGLARACARATAGAAIVIDEPHRIVVRMQDDRDRVLVPMLGKIVDDVRAALDRDFGIGLPTPLRIELVRDHFSLAEMTGLPETSARTTGTVAIANWGRVTMLSPRSMTGGYPWEVTLAHELTHVALGMATADRAPLWFQEGMAKFEETRWRAADPWDDYPSSDSLAATGYDTGLAMDIEHLGPSVAMLPTPQQAMVVFAQVHSFVRYVHRESGPQALPEIIAEMGRGSSVQDVRNAIVRGTGRPMEDWVSSWRRSLETQPRDVPAELGIGKPMPAGHGNAARETRLGELLLGRKQPGAAVRVLGRARESAPKELRIRALLAEGMMSLGRADVAREEVSPAGPPHYADPTAFALRGFFLRQAGDEPAAESSFRQALALAPWNPQVACERLVEPLVPRDLERAALCRAARQWPID